MLKKRILITAIGGDIAQAIATILKEEKPEWHLTGVDIHSNHGGQLFVDDFGLVPKASDPNYKNEIQRFVQQNQIDLIIPMSEAELQLHAKTSEDRTFRGIPLLMANYKAIEVGADKVYTAQYLESIGVPAPWTVDATEFNDQKHLPCIFKPRSGAGSKSVFPCTKKQEVLFYRETVANGILQELLLPADQEVTCGVFRSTAGRVAVVQLLRKLTGGFTGWAQVIHNEAIYNQCVKLAESLRLRGSINVQLRITEDGPRIFEINPRFSSTVLMRHRMGFSDLMWSIADLYQQPFEIDSPAVGTTAVRLQGAQLL